MKESADVLKEKGIVATPQRVAVWRFVKDNKEHPCAECVYGEIKKQFPSISLATVYTILETFKKAGLLNELLIRRGRVCFDPITESHHHLLCRNCNGIFDIEVKCEVSKAKEIDGHSVESIHGYFYGMCKECRKT